MLQPFLRLSSFTKPVKLLTGEKVTPDPLQEFSRVLSPRAKRAAQQGMGWLAGLVGWWGGRGSNCFWHCFEGRVVADVEEDDQAPDKVF